MYETEDPQRNGVAVSTKQRRRKKGSKKQSSSSWSSICPSEIVWTDRDLKKSKNSTELALLLGLAVVCLYLFGFFELMQSMPKISLKLRNYKLGRNLNLARMEMDPVGIDELKEVDVKKNSTPQEKLRESAPVVAGGSTNESQIPIGTWPVSVRGEEQETMIHVGDLKTIMKVPKFWSPPVHNNKQFTREQAMKIGTCAEPDPVTGSAVRGDDCPINERTIFIGIASYRDYQCRLTVESAFRRAKNPKRVRVGVVDQILVGEDVACNEPVKPCEEDPEQVRGHSAIRIANYEYWILFFCVCIIVAKMATISDASFLRGFLNECQIGHRTHNHCS